MNRRDLEIKAITSHSAAGGLAVAVLQDWSSWKNGGKSQILNPRSSTRDGQGGRMEMNDPSAEKMDILASLGFRV
jgi:hypothetical protein